MRNYLIFSSFSDVSAQVELFIVEVLVVQDVAELIHVAVDDEVHGVGQVEESCSLLILGRPLLLGWWTASSQLRVDLLYPGIVKNISVGNTGSRNVTKTNLYGTSLVTVLGLPHSPDSPVERRKLEVKVEIGVSFNFWSTRM